MNCRNKRTFEELDPVRGQHETGAERVEKILHVPEKDFSLISCLIEGSGARLGIHSASSPEAGSWRL